MKTLFWLLDLNEEMTKEGPEIHLWGLDDKSHRLLIVDRSVQPYFYLLLEESADSEKVVREIKEKSESFAVEVAGIVEKKYFGKPVKAVRVTCRDPSMVGKYATSLAKIHGVKMSLEQDIRYSSRYLIDNDVNPCGWHEIDVEKLDNRLLGVRAEEVFIAKSRPKALDRTENPPLRILSFSMICYSIKGSPKPDRSPVVIISVATNEGKEEQFVAKDANDKPVLEAFTKFVQAFNPDIIAGYGSNIFEWPYLLERTQRLGVKLQVDRSEGVPHTSIYGHISLTGRINIDLFELADEIPEVKIKTLENIAEYLEAIKEGRWIPIEEADIPQYWETNSERSTLKEYSSLKTSTILKVAQSLLNFAMQLSSLVGLPLDHVGTAAVGFRTESYLIKQAYKIGELVPPRVERPYIPYKGGIVLKPKPGLHEKTAVLDFKSMYPNIMIANNVSPDTYIGPDEKEQSTEVYVAPEVKYRFRKVPLGFYSKVLSNLIAARDEVRDKLKKFDSKSSEYRVLDARQRAVKIITNATYGYAGWVGARWYVRQVSEAAVAWGRYTITRAVDLAKREGLEVIYGDTDSIFVEFDNEKINRSTNTVQKELSLEIRPDEVYERIFFTEAKKRYAGLLLDGKLDIIGLEVARGDWSEAAKKVQEGVIDIILKEKSPEKASAFVQKFLTDLRAKKVPYHDLIIWKTLTREPNEYAIKAPHVEAAKRLLKEGWKLTPGDKIGFVIVGEAGKLYERALPYFLASYDKLDLKYYEQQQIIPSALRILSIFNVSEDNLKPKSSIANYL